MQPRVWNARSRSSPSLFCVRGLDDPYISIASLRRRRDARTRALRLRPSDFAGSRMRVSMTRRPIAPEGRDLESTCPTRDARWTAVFSSARFKGSTSWRLFIYGVFLKTIATRASRATCAQAQRATFEWCAAHVDSEPRGSIRTAVSYTRCSIFRAKIIIKGGGIFERNKIVVCGCKCNNYFNKYVQYYYSTILTFMMINSLINSTWDGTEFSTSASRKMKIIKNRKEILAEKNLNSKIFFVDRSAETVNEIVIRFKIISQSLLF